MGTTTRTRVSYESIGGVMDVITASYSCFFFESWRLLLYSVASLGGGRASRLGLSRGGGLRLLLPLEVHDDLHEKLAQASPIERLRLEVEHNLQVRLALLMRLPDASEEGMGERLVHRDAEVWVELQHAVQKITAVATRTRILLSHVKAGNVCETPEVAESLGVGDVGNVVVAGCSKHIEDHGELVVTSHGESVGLDAGVAIGTQREARLAREEGLSVQVSSRTLFHHAEHFGEDAADGPHVDSLSVVLLEEDELWRAVPTSDHVASQLALHVLAHVLRRLQLVHQLGAAVSGGLSLFFLFSLRGGSLSRLRCRVVHVHDAG